MSIPPSKRLRTKEVRAEEARSSDDAGPGPALEVRDGAVDSDPAGRLLHSLRDRERTGPSSAPPPLARAPFPPGTRVRVLRGPFVGRSGVVQELDGKGGARVMLGLLSTRIDLTDLAIDAEGGGRERMTLSSSHRKPR